jgi:hypothetical protein
VTPLSPTVKRTELRHNPADNAAAAALRTAADAAAAAAECNHPRILHAVLLAAAATAAANAQLLCTGTDRCTGHSAGTPTTRRTRRKAAPDSEGESQSPAPQKPEAHRHTSAKSHHQDFAHSVAARQSRSMIQQPPTAPQGPAGQARPQPGAPPTSSSNRAATSAMLATRPAKSRP